MVNRKVIKVLALLDCGADSCMLNADLKEYFNFRRIKIEDVRVNTIHETKNTLVERAKLSLLTNSNKVINVEVATNSTNLGKERKMDEEWFSMALKSLGIKQKCSDLFQTDRNGVVQVIIGLKSLSNLAIKVPLELLHLVQPPLSPELGIYYGDLDCEN